MYRLQMELIPINYMHEAAAAELFHRPEFPQRAQGSSCVEKQMNLQFGRIFRELFRLDLTLKNASVR